MICIYAYKKKSNNKIVYVGQTKNLKKRHYQHIHEAINNPNNREYNSILARGMRKYGVDAYELIVLEECAISELDEKEKYWIEYYDTFRHGYNCTKGGQGVSGAITHSDETIKKVASLLQNSSETMQTIADKTNTSVALVCMVNQGEHRPEILSNYSFPIKERTVDIQEKRFWAIVNELLNTSKTLKDISKDMDVPYEYVRRINNGTARHQSTLVYPLRKVQVNNYSTDPNFILQILQDILYSDMSLSKIAQKYNVSKTTIYKINHGETYKQENLTYPLR